MKETYDVVFDLLVNIAASIITLLILPFVLFALGVYWTLASMGIVSEEVHMGDFGQ